MVPGSGSWQWLLAVVPGSDARQLTKAASTHIFHLKWLAGTRAGVCHQRPVYSIAAQPGSDDRRRWSDKSCRL